MADKEKDTSEKEAEVATAEPKHQKLLGSIVTFLKQSGGKASKGDILAKFKNEPHETVNWLLTRETEVFTPSKEGEVKFYSLK